MASEHKRLGDLLLESGLLTEEQLLHAVTEQQASGELLGAALVRLGYVSEETLLHHLEQQLRLPLVDLDALSIDEQVLTYIKEDTARKYSALPLAIEGRSTLIVAMADPLNVAALEDLRFHCGMFIQPVLARPSAILEAIERYYHIDSSVDEVIRNIITTEQDVVVSTIEVDHDQPEALDDLIKEAEGRPIVRLTNWLLHRAVEERASDIHIEPQDRDLVVRFRIDGLLQEVQRLPKWTQGAVVSRIKVLSNLDIAEKRQPQDGHLVVEIQGRRIDMRVSTLPVTGGEKVVIRVVDQQRMLVPLVGLGLFPDDLARLQRNLDRPQGIVLVTGPTGSGKTTLLYSALRYIQHVTKNIVTVEDPVEFELAGINQVQVDERARKTFAAALRAILRQDPDVIMVGEIRDAETSQIAFRASVTGHLVLSTVHTNDAAGAVTRLVDLGLEPFMVASSLLAVVSMRLVRTLCPKCKESYEASPATLNRLGSAPDGGAPVKLWRAVGCSQCHDSGYSGRTGIFELLEVDDHIRSLVHMRQPDTVVRQAAVEAGMRSIGEDGLRKVLDGRTTLEEVMRVVYLAEQVGRVCPSCQSVLSQDFDYCPACGDFVGDHCESCRRRLHPDWTFCPYCGVDAEGSDPKSDGNGRPAEDAPKRPASGRRANGVKKAS